MGKFFNEKVKSMKKLPDSKEMEKMRRDFNHSMSEPEEVMTPAQIRMAKARAARKVKNG